MGVLFRPACWAMGHNWSKWYKIGKRWRHDCDFCDAVEYEE